MKTIVAISTALGAGGIGIIRLSGDEALKIACALFCSKEAENKCYTAKFMYFGTISTGNYCDKGYMVYFKAPASFTGEDVVEFHLHGGVKLLEGVVDACVKLGAAPAEKGEFSKRAFLNGKLALSDAEGIIDMINADSEAGVNAAYDLCKVSCQKRFTEYRQTCLKHNKSGSSI
jgi:tRNA modification GTPase